jgi:hypothetical protein
VRSRVRSRRFSVLTGLALAAVAVGTASILITSAQGELTHDEFVSQANSICHANQHRNHPVVGRLEILLAAGKLKQAARRVAHLTRSVQAEIALLGQLQPPASDLPAWSQFLSGLSESVGIEARAGKRLGHGDRRGYERLHAQATEVAIRAEEALTGFGLLWCAGRQ